MLFVQLQELITILGLLHLIVFIQMKVLMVVEDMMEILTLLMFLEKVL